MTQETAKEVIKEHQMDVIDRYEGIVELRRDGEVVKARARYQVFAHPRTGMQSWRGRLDGITPSHLDPGDFMLLRPDGDSGQIIVNHVRFSTRMPETATFVGTGPAPGM